MFYHEKKGKLNNDIRHNSQVQYGETDIQANLNYFILSSLPL